VGPVQVGRVETVQVPVASEGFAFWQIVPETQVPLLAELDQQVEPAGRSDPWHMLVRVEPVSRVQV